MPVKHAKFPVCSKGKHASDIKYDEQKKSQSWNSNSEVFYFHSHAKCCLTTSILETSNVLPWAGGLQPQLEFQSLLQKRI